MPRSKEHLEHIKQEKRQRILMKALELFARKGYHKTTMDDIASASKISKGLIYNYFSNKQELLISILLEYLNEMKRLIADKDPQTLTEQELIELILQAFRLMDNYSRDALGFYYMLMAQQDIKNITLPIIQEFIQENVKFITPFFRKKGIENPEVYILTFIASLDGIGMYSILLDIDKTEEMLNIAIQKFIKL